MYIFQHQHRKPSLKLTCAICDQKFTHRSLMQHARMHRNNSSLHGRFSGTFTVQKLCNFSHVHSAQRDSSSSGTLGREKGIRRQGWSRRNLLGFLLHLFEWFFILHPPIRSPPLRNSGLLGNSPTKKLSLLLKMLRISIRKLGFTYNLCLTHGTGTLFRPSLTYGLLLVSSSFDSFLLA